MSTERATRLLITANFKKNLRSEWSRDHEPLIEGLVCNEHTCNSASLVSFIKQNILHEMQLRYPNLKIYLKKRIKELYCGFTDDTKNFLREIILRTQSNRSIWRENLFFFITGGHERNSLSNNNRPKLGIAFWTKWIGLTKLIAWSKIPRKQKKLSSLRMSKFWFKTIYKTLI